MKVMVNDGPHTPSGWWDDITQQDCGAELIARCRGCRKSAFVHVDPSYVAEYGTKYRNKWPIKWFEQNGWRCDEADDGLCPGCLELMGLVQWSPN